MRTLTFWIAASLVLAGCKYVEFVDEGDDPPKSKDPKADKYEPNPGGRLMTAMQLKKIYMHTIWPANDVDFSYLKTHGSPGSYTIFVEAAKGDPVRVQIWTRPSPTRGPSKRVYLGTLAQTKWVKVKVTTTSRTPCIAIRVDAAEGRPGSYLIKAEKNPMSRPRPRP